ncbi:hypothetical protein RO3G_03910 [Rhizopus delemar RA 99-880]|uniref:Uncharacterized protein n=1 Tax=Rhizopus delemar (strain RA 99-880 / ATCC MYA-4621 / FGSC 9543 / NRRL 43880) TaxID=246409 RepID=I1BSM5_RHIO9|nr:hypothetical protein RO3G_03910 [Rhizopus delemar RA 99-880]|eukprot:EIE79205.1 hypothetical protein RO3G_03910 [Rhizopus delemar RA 99-880]
MTEAFKDFRQRSVKGTQLQKRVLDCRMLIQKRLDDDQLSKDEVNGKIDEKVTIIAKRLVNHNSRKEGQS